MTIEEKIFEYCDKAIAAGHKLIPYTNGEDPNIYCFLMAVVNPHQPGYVTKQWIHDINKELGTNYSAQWFIGFLIAMGEDPMNYPEKIRNKIKANDIEYHNGFIFGENLLKLWEKRNNE